MSKTLHVIFDGKVLRPEEPVDLTPNTHYVVTIEHEEKLGIQNLWDVLGDLTGKVEGPENWSQEHNHYLYGTPKRKKGFGNRGCANRNRQFISLLKSFCRS